MNKEDDIEVGTIWQSKQTPTKLVIVTKYRDGATHLRRRDARTPDHSNLRPLADFRKKSYRQSVVMFLTKFKLYKKEA